MLKLLLRLIILLMRGGDIMVDMYLALVMNHRRQIPAGGPLAMVPVTYSDAVMADLTALGLDGFGNLIVVG